MHINESRFISARLKATFIARIFTPDAAPSLSLSEFFLKVLLVVH